jgi:hypothetical protein
VITDRKGRRVSELAGPGVSAAAPSHALPDYGDWKWAGWFWCGRALLHLPSWRNQKLNAWACEGAGYWRVTGRGRAYGTGDTFQEAWLAMVAREYPAGVTE